MPDQPVYLPGLGAPRASYDVLVQRLAECRISLSEEELLRESHWKLGQDARMREDFRFTETPWGRWVLADAHLTNDDIYQICIERPALGRSLSSMLDELEKASGGAVAFCTGDSRFVVDGDDLRLSARELTDHPLIESDIPPDSMFVTHLPVLTLAAAAASQPAGQWGATAPEQDVQGLGWVRVKVGGRKPNSNMFVARIEGNSMDNGSSGLEDGRFAVFEFWPKGSRQNLTVLVRGSFVDPETGSYALKKYLADARDQEGRHGHIRLISLNPDKKTYPDILLDPNDDSEVTVVAQLVQPLLPSDFLRLPRAPRKPGERDITTREGVRDLAEKAAQSLVAFFGEPAAGEAPEPPAQEVRPPRWVFSTLDGGALQLEFGPLPGLPKHVEKLFWFNRDDTSIPILASNIRFHPVRIDVAPGSGPWRLQVHGPETDSEFWPSTPYLEPLSKLRPSLFQVGADSRFAQLVKGNQLALGKEYVVLVPEALSPTDALPVTWSSCCKGWNVWRLEVDSTTHGTHGALLQHLKLTVAQPSPSLQWAPFPPTAWGVSRKGESFGRFRPGHPMSVRISDWDPNADGEALLVLHGPQGSSNWPVKPETPTFFSLSDLGPGRYCLMLVHRLVQFELSALCFEVADTTVPAVTPDVLVRLGDTTLACRPSVGIRMLTDAFPMSEETDLRDLTPAEASLAPPSAPPESQGNPRSFQVQAPPLWPVRIVWQELTERHIARLQADEYGNVDASAILLRTGDYRRQRSTGNLVLDFGDLGRIALKHARQFQMGEIHKELRKVLNGAYDLLHERRCPDIRLRSHWFGPVCALLGQELAPMTAVAEATPIPECEVHRLVRVERTLHGISASTTRLFVWLPDCSLLDDKAIREWIDRQADAERVRQILVSDGFHWAARQVRNRTVAANWDIRRVVDDETLLEEFVGYVGEGI